MTQLTVLLGPHDDAGPLLGACREAGSRHGGRYSLRQWGQTIEFAHESNEAVTEARNFYEGRKELGGMARTVNF